MSFCSKCGSKASKKDTYCPRCGAKVKEEKESINSAASLSTNQNSTQGGKSGVGWSCAIVGCGCLGLIILVIVGIMALSFLGAKGQPGTIVKPTSIKTPKDLVAAGVDNSIKLNWGKSDSANIAKYNVYKSKVAGKDYQLAKAVDNPTDTTYADSSVDKGVSYYYVVTAVAGDGVESGNSNQANYTLPAPPLLPNGVQNWQDVLTKFDADKKYAELFTKVTGLSRSDIEKYISLQNKGKSLNKKLKKGTVITNTTEKYKILYNYTLNEDKWFLTDDKSIPRVMVWCGNPIKLIHEMTAWGEFVQGVQTFTYNVIYVLPVSVTNTIIDASQPVNNGFSTFIPGIVSPDSYTPDQTQPTASPGSAPLTEGQQWAVEGHLLVEANPHDPDPGQSVEMTVTLTSSESGVAVEYSISGTDGYQNSGTANTDGEGKIRFTIPGGAGGIVDTINIKVPSKSLEGSTSYTF